MNVKNHYMKRVKKSYRTFFLLIPCYTTFFSYV